MHTQNYPFKFVCLCECVSMHMFLLAHLRFSFEIVCIMEWNIIQRQSNRHTCVVHGNLIRLQVFLLEFVIMI